MSEQARLRLTLGPVLYLWQPDVWRDFYYRVADEGDVDTVVIGEVVCSKRQHMHQPLYAQVIERLQRGGKQVRLASLALVTLGRELRATRDLANQPLEVEANELSAHNALRGRRHAIGPFVNVYNAATARVLAGRGAGSICLPPELPITSIRSIAADVPGVDFEVFAFGRVPLAISARCAHARVKGLTKDTCQFVCGEDPDGLSVRTLADQPFLSLNGVQTVSDTCHVAFAELAALAAGGIRSVRLSPQQCDMVAVAKLHRAVADGELEPPAATDRLQALYPGVRLSNGFLHGQAGHLMVAGAA